MNRQQALDLLRTYIRDPYTIKHCLASEAVLRALAQNLGEDVEKWGLAGLLHDIDYEKTSGNPKTHGLEAVKMLSEHNIDAEVIEAIKLHNEMAEGVPARNKKFHHALAAGETITGLITATALVYPDKKLSSVKTKSITKRMKEKAFAASVNRDVIMECDKIGLPIDQFAEISLQAMCGISDVLGL
ncbi:MAG: HDIG domain-containing metalloprotein [Pseudomonadota bacterium]